MSTPGKFINSKEVVLESLILRGSDAELPYLRVEGSKLPENRYPFVPNNLMDALDDPLFDA